MNARICRSLGVGLLTLMAIGCGCSDEENVGQNGKVPPDNPKTERGNEPVANAVKLSPAAIAKNNRAFGLMAHADFGGAREIYQDLVEEYPDWLDARVNLAIATLNAEKGIKTALPILADVLNVEPDHVRANYCTAVSLDFAGRRHEALPFLQKVFKHDENDPYVTFQMGQCIESIERESKVDAIRWYQKTVEIDPYFRQAYYRLFFLLRGPELDERTMEFMQTFEALGNDPRTRVYKHVYTYMGPKAEVVIGHSSPADPIEEPSGPIFEDAVALSSSQGMTWPTSDGLEQASITACNLNGYPYVDLLFLAGAVQKGNDVFNAVYVVADDGRIEFAPEHPLADIPGVQAALWGDFDNDDLTDVYFCRRGANQLWRQSAPNEWQNVTESTQTAGGEEVNTIGGSFLDADHDGDLDLFLLNADAPNELLNNNRDGTFAPLAAKAGIGGGNRTSIGVLPVDLDQDRDLDLIVINQQPPHDVFLNDRLGRYHPTKALAEFAASEIVAAVTADADANGRPEIYCLGPDGLCRWRRTRKRVWEKTILKADAEIEFDKFIRMAAVDVTGDGDPELIVGGKTWQVFRITGDQAELLYSADGQPLVGWSVVVLDSKRGPSIIGMPVKNPPLLWSPGDGRYPFISLALSGKEKEKSKIRSNASALGARIEIRTGSRWSSLDFLRSESGPGQSLQPLAVGLRGRAKADFVRIRWPDGVSQGELDFEPGAHQIDENDRFSTSCPVLFVWSGERYEFVSDLLGVGGLGYLVAPDEYATPDPTESFLLPAGRMAAVDGVFRMKLTEPMEELTYLDSAALTAYDLPPGWRMTLDERMGINPPLPTGEPIFYRRQMSPVSAVNDRNEDVMTSVRQADYVAAPPGPLDKRFIGRLETEHVLQFTFAEPIDQQPGRPVLVADGWIEYPYSQTVYAAWQAKAHFHAPTLEARDVDGNWQVVHHEFGYPAGMPRQMSVPLDNLPPGTKELRLRTNQEIYWDRLSIVYAEECPQVHKQTLAIQKAKLRESGFTPRILKPQHRPTFNYEDRIPLAETRDPAGYYTEFGPVEELITQTDDAVAIFGPGEEIHLEFKVPANKPPGGWSRRFVLSVVGWCKDTDLYTANGETVEPLPTNGQTTEQRNRLHRRYNTRYQSGR